MPSFFTAWPDDQHDAASGGFTASARAADLDRLAGDDGGDGLAHVHGVGVHHPGHGLLVGVDVRGGHVLFRADDLDQLGGEAAGHALQFAARHRLGIADDSTLGAAKGNVDDGALPGHPGGEGAHFVEVDLRGVANAALGRTARHGVLHPIAGEEFDAAIIHLHRDVYGDFARRLAENLPETGVEVELSRGQFEARCLRLPGIGLHVRVDCG